MSHPVVRPSIVLFVLAILAGATAQAPVIAPGSFSVLAKVTGAATSGTQELFVLDGDARLDSTPDDGEALVVLFAQDEGAYVLRGYFGEATQPAFEAPLDAILADDQLYRELAELLVVFLNPASPAHPCQHTRPDDGAVLTGDFEVWECEIVGTETLAGRATSVWTYDVVWGREGRPAIVNDPTQTAWIDDELGVPLAYHAGPDLFVTEFVSVDPSVQDASLFTSR